MGDVAFRFRAFLTLAHSVTLGFTWYWYLESMRLLRENPALAGVIRIQSPFGPVFMLVTAVFLWAVLVHDAFKRDRREREEMEQVNARTR